MDLELTKKIFSIQDTSQLKGCQSLLLTSVWSLPSLLNENEYIVIVEAAKNKELVGVILAKVFLQNQTGQILSFMVKEAHRRQGIGLALFRFLENSLVKEDKVYAVGIEYEEGAASTAAIEKILKHQGWSIPPVYLMRCHFDSYQFNPNWLYLPFRLPPDMEFFSWKELTAQDREKIQEIQDKQNLFHLWPFREEGQIDLSTSVGLRYKSQLIGWSITHRIDPDTIRYSILYIEKSFQSSGFGIQLLIESIRRHDRLMHGDQPASKALFEIRLQDIPPSWTRFVEKRLIPHAVKVDKMKWAVKFFIENIPL